MIEMLQAYGAPATVATTGGALFRPGGGSSFPPVMAVKWMSDVWDQLAPLYVTSPITAKLEAYVKSG